MLITLVIIGVIAALTIPNLMQKYQEQTTVKKVQKFYSNLANAYALAMKDNGDAGEWGLTDNKDSAIKIYDLLFKPYFKIAKDCGTDNSGDCITNNTYKYFNSDTTNKSISYNNAKTYKIILDDSSTVFWHATSTDEQEYSNIYVIYDTNGKKAPNQCGKDTFIFTVLKGKVFPLGTQSENDTMKNFTRYCNTKSTSSISGIGCAAWVVYKGNMDYLHCDDLSWTGKDKCK